MGDRSLLTNSYIRRAVSFGAIALLSAAGAMAQDQQTVPAQQQQDQAPHPWRSAADAPPDPAMQPPPQSNTAPAPPGYSNYPSFPAAPQGGQLPDPGTPLPGQAAGQPNGSYQGQGGQYGGQRPYAGQNGPYPGQNGPYAGQPQPAQPQPPVPAHLTVKPGAFIMVRTTQGLSSDHNQQGDTFFATLAEPLIVDGVVVAQRGETVSGRVTEAQKAGRVEGTSKLGVELTGITLVDGQQVPIQSQMISHSGPTSVGRDVGAIGTTTALGAAIGAGADWGRGAAIGAGAGAAAGILGVLLTRGRPTVVYPESTLTFRINAPVEIATDRAPQAFHFASSRDYGTAEELTPNVLRLRVTLEDRLVPDRIIMAPLIILIRIIGARVSPSTSVAVAATGDRSDETHIPALLLPRSSAVSFRSNFPFFRSCPARSTTIS